MTYHSFSREMVAIAVRASEKILARDVFPDFSFHPYGLPIGGIEKTVELASIPMQIGFPPTQVGFIEYTNTNGEKSRVTACRQSFDPESAFINCLLSSFGQKLGLPTAPCVVDKEGNQAWFYSIIPYPHVIEANHLIEKTAGNITSRPGPHCEKWQRVRPLLERQQPADLEFRIFKDNIPFFSAEIPFNEWICYDDIGRHNLGVDLEAVEKAFRPGNNATAVIPVYRFDFCNRFDRWSEGSYHALSKALVNGEYGAYFYDSDEKKLALLNQLAQEAFLPFIDQGPMRKVISDIRNFTDAFIHNYVHGIAQIFIETFKDKIPDHGKFLEFVENEEYQLISRRNRLEDFMQEYLRPTAPSSGNPFLTFRYRVDGLAANNAISTLTNSKRSASASVLDR